MSRLTFAGTVVVCMVAIPAMAQGVSIKDVRIAFERNDDNLVVKELMTLSLEPAPAERPPTIEIPYPQHAAGVQLAESSKRDGVSLGPRTVTIRTESVENKLSLGISFLLPIKRGIVAFDQTLGVPVTLAHAALLFPGDRGTLKGDGFAPTQRHQTPDGLPALFTVGRDFEKGHLMLLISGLDQEDGQMRMLATVISFGMLLAGLFFWFRRKFADKAS